MAKSEFVPLSQKSQEKFLAYYRSVQSMQNPTRNETRARMERIDRQYQREVDLTQEQKDAKIANNSGDPTRYQNMTVPVVLPQVESAVTHQSSVFLSGPTLFETEAPPEFIDEALQLDSVLDDQARRGGWARDLILFFRDGAKYNFAPIEVSWEREVTNVVETALDRELDEGVPKQVIWEGNNVRRLDPYNTFVDTRVNIAEVYKDGEYAGWTEFQSRIKLKAFISELPDKIIGSIKPAFESGLGGSSTAKDASAMNYYIPSINPEVSEEDYRSAGTNWLKWAGIEQDKELPINYKDGYEVTTIYCRVLPSEFALNIPNSNTPQIYKLIFINHEHIIYAERQTNAHNWLPILIGQPTEDGLNYQTKSLGENSVEFQQLASTYMNSIIASRRRAISDRVLFDPSRITNAAINSPNPSAKIPVRPAAYGKNLSDSVYAFPYREDQQSTSMAQIGVILELSDKVAGQNKVDQGQFVKGNKTDSQFNATLRSSSGRDALASTLLEDQVFIPMKTILRLNILQFQGGVTIFNRDKKVVVEVDPIKLRKAVLEFKVNDGLTREEKQLTAESFTIGLQAISTSPEIAAEYNVGQLFSYLMKTQGADLTPFEKSPEQIAYEQALRAWQQVIQLAIEKGVDAEEGIEAGTLPPQPLPKQFGYDPQLNKPAPSSEDQLDTSVAGSEVAPAGQPPTTNTATNTEI